MRIGRVVRTTEARTAGTLTLYWPWNVHSAHGSTRFSGVLGRISGRGEPLQIVRAVLMVPVTSAGRVSGNARFHSIFHSLAPSSRIDSKSSLGTSRTKLDRTSTDSGIANAMDGRMIASRVS